MACGPYLKTIFAKIAEQKVFPISNWFFKNESSIFSLKAIFSTTFKIQGFLASLPLEVNIHLNVWKERCSWIQNSLYFPIAFSLTLQLSNDVLIIKLSINNGAVSCAKLRLFWRCSKWKSFFDARADNSRIRKMPKNRELLDLGMWTTLFSKDFSRTLSQRFFAQFGSPERRSKFGHSMVSRYNGRTLSQNFNANNRHFPYFSLWNKKNENMRIKKYIYRRL